MNRAETQELIRLCRLHLTERRLPKPLPTTPEEFQRWEAEQSAAIVNEEAEDAWLDLSDLAANQPTEAWPLVLELVRGARDEDELGTIGAGPLETFVAYHGTTHAAAIEDEMSGNPKLVIAMRSVRGIHEHPELSNRLWRFFGE